MVAPSLFLTENNIALATDLYQLTMAGGYFEHGIHYPSSFELFVRRMPQNRSYLIAAGLEQAIHYLLNVRFTEEAISYLKTQPPFASLSRDFFDYLRAFRFTGDLEAMPEGTIFFPGEPVLRITAPMIEAQIVETYLLAVINYQILVATKASRIVQAAQGRPVVDFGTRRAHGPQAGILAARASFIGGCTGTSNVLAGMELGIPIIGTAAHSWTMTFDTEREAFWRYHEVFPEHTLLLIDTYDTLEGARHATELGEKLRGVRLDSGDLVILSRQVRKILDDAGLHQAKIVASGDLNEYKISDLLAAGAQIDLFGVGTEMVTSRDDPTLSGVYKLVEQRRGRKTVYALKLSEEKATYPGRKQIFRQDHRDVIGLVTESLPGQPLLKPYIRQGMLCTDLPAIADIQERAQEQLHALPPEYRRWIDPIPYPVEYSTALQKLRDTIAGLRRV